MKTNPAKSTPGIDSLRTRNSFELTLQSRKEEVVQAYLANHPEILISVFRPPWSGGTTQCFPKFRLGAEFVCDFLILDGHYGRWDITLIELEPPHARAFTKAGNFARRLNEALRQVHEWFAWIHENPTYFRAALSRHCSEFAGESLETPPPEWMPHRSRVMTCAKIIIGRRSMLTPTDNSRRHTVFAESERKIEIIPYDRLVKFYDYDLRRDAQLNDAADRRLL
jgi:hypothetical protein